MLLFPFTTLNWTLETWAYAATIGGGKYLDAAAYYSSLGLVMDLFWLAVVLVSWRVLTREYWRTQIVPADPTCGRGSAGGSPSGASSRSTGRRSSTACAA